MVYDVVSHVFVDEYRRRCDGTERGSLRSLSQGTWSLLLLLGVQRVETRLRGQLRNDVRCSSYDSLNSGNCGCNLRRQKNRRLASPFHWNELICGLLASSYVVLALVARLLMDWRATIAPKEF